MDREERIADSRNLRALPPKADRVGPALVAAKRGCKSRSGRGVEAADRGNREPGAGWFDRWRPSRRPRRARLQ